MYPPGYCGSDAPAPYQPSGPIYCASSSWKDTPPWWKCVTSPFLTPYHVSGHLNFAVATYEGIVRWDNAQAEYNFDSDWCMNLYTPHGVGVSGLKDDEPWIHTEVDPKDVGDGFDRGFWQTFRDNIHNGQEYCGDLQYCSGTTDNQNKTVAPMINGKRAIVVGLLGLDMGHRDAGAELHPIYGVAIHTGGRTLTGSDCNWSSGHCHVEDDVYLHPEQDPLFDVPQDAKDDTWAIWAANYGNEGYCSTRASHVLGGDGSIIGRKEFPTMSFRLPWARDAAGRPMADVEVLDATNFALHAGKDLGRSDAVYDVAIDRGASIIVTFHMWPSDARPYWFGELHLAWKLAPGYVVATLPRVPLTPAHPERNYLPPEAEEHPTMANMTEAQKKAFLAEMRTHIGQPNIQGGVSRKSIIGTRATAPPPPPASIQPRPPGTQGSPTPRGTEENIWTKKALCAAHAGAVPNTPADFCGQKTPAAVNRNTLTVRVLRDPDPTCPTLPAGIVQSSPGGLICQLGGQDETCVATFAPGTMVTLTASEIGHTRFQGFSGACSGMTCSISMDTDRNVAATFCGVIP